MVELKKINENIWQLEGTKVPAFVFASEKLLEIMKKDDSLRQLENMTHLPGIYEAIALPDSHRGYGFCIGGVAALDFEKGGISPGGIGYDINCFGRDTHILTSHGYYKHIQDFERDFIELENINAPFTLKTKHCAVKLFSFDAKRQSYFPKDAAYFMKRKHTGNILSIKTRAGYTIRVTNEHPILTKTGMVTAGLLNAGQEIAVFPFSGVAYEESDDSIIIDEGIGLSTELKRELEKRNLLPLKMSNPAIPIIAKLFGYLLGDGSIRISAKSHGVGAYSKSLSDLKEVKQDIESLGFSASIYERKRRCKIITQYGIKDFFSHSYELHASSRALAQLFFMIGYPNGPKTKIPFIVPKWIMRGPRWIQRLFLSGLFGAELSSPRTHTKTGFDCPTFSMNKNTKFKKNGRMFCVHIMKLLENFGVVIDLITDRSEFKNKYGRTSRVRLQISSNENNLLRLWTTIGFGYNHRRSFIADCAVLYIKSKQRITAIRSALTVDIKSLKKKGLKLSEVQAMLSDKGINSRFIERHYYENAKQRIPLNFISFDDFVKTKKKENDVYGTLFDSIESISLEKYDDFVYDFNVSDTHTIIADNIITSNCGVRLLTTPLMIDDVKDKMSELIDCMYKTVPAGLGEGNVKISVSELNDVLNNGAEWAVKHGYGFKEDIENSEESGNYKGADASKVSDGAKKRGKNQLGSLGSGNHFLEVQVVDQVLNENVAKVFGLKKGQIVVMIHCGSRGLGHQVCSDYLRLMEKEFADEITKLPDRELIYAPSGTKLCSDYLAAMKAAANFAWCNRHIIADLVRNCFVNIFGIKKESMHVLYDVAHNIAKIEEQEFDGKKVKVFMHRKGATRAFGPGNKEIPEIYRKVGQPVIIPGSMGTASYVLVGTKEGMKLSLGSTAHGAGRMMSRTQALRDFKGESVVSDLRHEGIIVKGHSITGIAEEAPGAYKDIDEVVKVSDELGIAKIVVRLRPLGVVKG